MRLYRLAKDKPGKYSASDISGHGAAIAGGRWNPIGMPALYTSLNASTAVLEVRVHATGIMPESGLFLVEVEIPDAMVDAAHQPTLPGDWTSLRVPASTVEIGRDWLLARKTLAMKVPSVVCIADWNLILNPLHPDFPKIKVTREEAFALDARLFR